MIEYNARECKLNKQKRAIKNESNAREEKLGYPISSSSSRAKKSSSSSSPNILSSSSSPSSSSSSRGLGTVGSAYRPNSSGEMMDSLSLEALCRSLASFLRLESGERSNSSSPEFNPASEGVRLRSRLRLIRGVEGPL